MRISPVNFFVAAATASPLVGNAVRDILLRAACPAVTSQVTSCTNQKLLTAYCSSLLQVQTVFATLTRTSVSRTTETVTQTTRTVSSTVATVTASPTFITVTPTTTTTITNTASTTTVTTVAAGFTCTANAAQSAGTANAVDRRQAQLPTPLCLKVYSQSADIESACSCLAIPTTTIVTVSTASSTTTITSTIKVAATSSVTKTLSNSATSIVSASTTVSSTVTTTVTPTATSTISANSRFKIQAINQPNGPGDHQWLVFNSIDLFQAPDFASGGTFRWQNGTCNIIDTVYEPSDEIYLVLANPSCTGCQTGTQVIGNYYASHSNPSVYCTVNASTGQLSCASTSGESVTSVCNDSTANGTWYIENGVRTRGTTPPYVCMQSNLFAQFI